MRLFIFGLLVTMGAVAMMPVTKASAQGIGASQCTNLWIWRNSIYKNRAYCFTTPEAIQFFGNQGCRYNASNVPLTAADWAQINSYLAQEKALRCPAQP
jgi:hypothetical protein